MTSQPTLFDETDPEPPPVGNGQSAAAYLDGLRDDPSARPQWPQSATCWSWIIPCAAAIHRLARRQARLSVADVQRDLGIDGRGLDVQAVLQHSRLVRPAEGGGWVSAIYKAQG